MSDVGKLVVAMEARTRSFENAMNKALGVAKKRATDIEDRFDKMNNNISASFKKVMAFGTAGLSGILSVREIAKMADTWSDLNARLRNSAGSVEEADMMMKRLGQSARVTYSSLEDTVNSFISNSTAIKELGYSTETQLDYTEALNNALVVSGAKGERAASIMDNLSKAMASGKLSGQELNNVIKNGGKVAEVLATELGISTNQLRKWGEEGRITSSVMINAFVKQKDELQQMAEAMPATLGDGIQLLKNAMLEYVGGADSAVGISGKIAEALVIMADNFDKVADVALQVAGVIAGALVGRSLAGMIRSLALTGTQLIKFIGLLRQAQTASQALGAFGGMGALGGPLGMIAGGALTLAVGYYAKSAWEAKQRSEELTNELTDMGLAALGVEGNVDKLGKALLAMSSIDKVQKINDIENEIKNLTSSKQSGWFNKNESSASRIGDLMADTTPFVWDRGVDGQVIDKYRSLLQLLQQFPAAAGYVKDGIDELSKTKGISEDVVKTLKDGYETAKSIQLNVNALTAFTGQNEAFEQAKQKMEDLKSSIQSLHDQKLLSDDAFTQISDLISSFEKGTISAQQLGEGVNSITKDGATALIGLQHQVETVGEGFQAARQEAQSVSSALQQLNGTVVQAVIDITVVGTGLDLIKNNEEAQKQWNEITAKMNEDNKLSQKEINRQNEARQLISQMGAKGAYISEDQALEQADKNIAARDRRSKENQKGRSGSKKKENEYERAVQSTQEDIKLLERKKEIYESLNPLVDDYEYSIMKAEKQQELLNAAEKAKLEITPALQASIEAQAEQYAVLAIETQKAETGTNNLKNTLEDLRDTSRGAMSGFISDLREGKTASEALANALTKVADKFFELTMSSLFGGGNAGAGLLGGIGKLFGFSEGGYTGDGGTYEPKGVVHGGEYVFSKKAVQKIGAGNLDTMHRQLKGYAQGGAVGMPISIPSVPSKSSYGSQDVVDIVLQDDSGRMAEIADQRIQTKSGAIINVAVNKSISNVKRNINTIAQEGQARYG